MELQEQVSVCLVADLLPLPQLLALPSASLGS